MQLREEAPRRSFALGVVLALAGAGWSCGGADLRTGDLEAIRAAGELRVVVRPGFLSSPVHQRGLRDERAMLAQLAKHLGGRVRWVEVDRNDQVLSCLVQGRGDLAVSRFSPDALQGTGAVATATVQWVDDQVVVWPGSGLRRIDGLADQAVNLVRSSEYWPAAARLKTPLERAGLVPVPEEVTYEEVLSRVLSGRYPATIVDSALLGAWPGGSHLRVLGKVGERRQVVWAVREGNPNLRGAVNDFILAENVLARANRRAACRDLAEVRAAGALRLVTRSSPTCCSLESEGLEGFEYRLAEAFSQELGVRLELVIPPPSVDPLAWLEEGFGDLAALHEPLSLEDEGRFLETVPYRYVDLVTVVGAAGDLPAAVDDLAGRSIAAAPQVASLCALLPLVPPLVHVDSAAGADGLSAVVDVARGRAEVAVVDEDMVRLELAAHSGLRRGCIVLPAVGLCWLGNPSSPKLVAAASVFLRSAARNGLLQRLVLRQLGGVEAASTPSPLAPVPRGSLTPYDALLQDAGRRYGVDWRLLAAVIYEESSFDPSAVGAGGAAGLFQLMPATWRGLGVQDPHHPEQAVEAGARYLRELMDVFADLPHAERVPMALAAYNVGLRHVLDARRLAAEMNLDPDRWEGGVKTAMIALGDPEVARRYPGGVCRCERAVGYARRLVERWADYMQRFPSA